MQKKRRKQKNGEKSTGKHGVWLIFSCAEDAVYGLYARLDVRACVYRIVSLPELIVRLAEKDIRDKRQKKVACMSIVKFSCCDLTKVCTSWRGQSKVSYDIQADVVLAGGR